MNSAKNDLVTAVSVQMLAEFTNDCGKNLSGTLKGKHLEEPYEFQDLIHMIYKMEEIFDDKRFPEAFLTPRMFNRHGSGHKKLGFNEEVAMAVNKTKKDSLAESSVPNNAKCTFEINVKFRQNASWQGQIVWLERNQKQSFRSVLEMLKLMDEALTESDLKAENVTWET